VNNLTQQCLNNKLFLESQLKGNENSTKILSDCYSLRPEIPNGESLREQPNYIQKYTSLMTHCWAQEPESRPTFEDILFILREILKEKAQLEQLSGLPEEIVVVRTRRNSSVGMDTEGTQESLRRFWQIDFNELSFEESEVIGEKFHGNFQSF
jgi:hypothetical protein